MPGTPDALKDGMAVPSYARHPAFRQGTARRARARRKRDAVRRPGSQTREVLPAAHADAGETRPASAPSRTTLAIEVFFALLVMLAWLLSLVMPNQPLQ
ncbi:MAG: hypothetical protein ACQGVC_02330 [Myxococcota bacterium]